MRIPKLDSESILENLLYHRDKGELPRHVDCYLMILKVAESLPHIYNEIAIANLNMVIDACFKLLEVDRATWDVEENTLPAQQAKVYAQFGPGFIFLPRIAAERPADFLMDDRVNMRKADKKRVLRAVEDFERWARERNFNTHSLLSFPDIHNCGIF